MQNSINLMADWWCSQITTISPNSNNGDNSSDGGMAFILGNLLNAQSRNAMPPDAPQKFKEIFVKKAMEHYKESGVLPEMSVDYDPSRFLYDVAKEASISPNTFPCKSCSIIMGGKPYAKCGYNASWQELSVR